MKIIEFFSKILNIKSQKYADDGVDQSKITKFANTETNSSYEEIEDEETLTISYVNSDNINHYFNEFDFSNHEETIQINYIKSFQQNSKFKEGAIPLCVPFADKDKVKSLGAFWCYKFKSWFWKLDKNREEIKQWLPLIYRADLYPPYITPNLVPKPIWFINLRSLLLKEEWDMLRKIEYEKTGRRCKICGGKGQKWPVDCDEIWEYIDPNPKDTSLNGKVILKGLNALCPKCHQIKHLGKAYIDGEFDEAVLHMANINKWPQAYAYKIAEQAFNEWDFRSKIKWEFDFTWLDQKYGIIVHKDKLILENCRNN
jgi:hypothetical protein